MRGNSELYQNPEAFLILESGKLELNVCTESSVKDCRLDV